MSLPGVCAAGTIVGRVSAEGKQVPGADGGGNAYGGRRARFVETIDYSRIHDFVVHVVGEVPGADSPPAAPVAVITHRDSTFSPKLLPVMAGTTVIWPNQDDYYHNAFSVSDAKPFDLGLYKEEVKRITFDTPGTVDVFCSIHKDMHCVIVVLANPFFAATDTHGRYRIEDVPPGTYTLRAWHQRLPAQTRQIEVPAEGEVEADFLMGVTGLPSY